MTTPFRPVIRNQRDLEAAWRQLMEPLGFGGHSIWFMLIGRDHVPLPQLTEVADCREPVGHQDAPGLAMTLHTIMADHDPGGRWAFLRSRPGRGGADEHDRAWAGLLYATCRDRGIAHEVVFLATDERVAPIPLDDVTDYLRAS
jgi:hypothetical protein